MHAVVVEKHSLFENVAQERSLGEGIPDCLPPTLLSLLMLLPVEANQGRPSCTVLRVRLLGHRAGLRRAATESEAGDQMETQPPEETERRRSKPSSRDRQTKRNQVRCRVYERQ